MHGHPAEFMEGSVIEVENIPLLLRDVARFAEAVEKLKDMVMGDGKRDGLEKLSKDETPFAVKE